jgi:DNA-binding FadR family transcriptional regulator
MDTEATLAPIVSSNLNELISARLKNYIEQNGLRAGDKLPTEEKLSQNLGVSRTVVREALRSLEALGVVEARQGYGRVVCNFNFGAILNNLSYGLVFQNNDILQITDIRKALDSYFTGPAIRNLTEQDRAELVQLVGTMQERSRAGLGISEQDHRFHQLLFQRCNNPLALQLFEITWTVRLNAYDRDSALRESPPGTAHEHTAILEAILRKDVETARQLMLDHHWNTEERFRGRIKQEMQRTEMQRTEVRRIREEVREETIGVEP